MPLSVSSPCKGEDEGEGPFTAGYTPAIHDSALLQMHGAKSHKTYPLGMN